MFRKFKLWWQWLPALTVTVFWFACYFYCFDCLLLLVNQSDEHLLFLVKSGEPRRHPNARPATNMVLYWKYGECRILSSQKFHIITIKKCIVLFFYPKVLFIQVWSFFSAAVKTEEIVAPMPLNLKIWELNNSRWLCLKWECWENAQAARMRKVQGTSCC